VQLCKRKKATADGDCSTQRNTTESPLLRLPGELRNRIYGYVFDVDSIRVRESPSDLVTATVVDTTSSASTRVPDYPLIDMHSLTWTCRLLYNETKLLPYQFNTFDLPLWALRPILRRSPGIVRMYVGSLLVHTGGYSAGKDEEAFLKQEFQIKGLRYMPAVKHIMVKTFNKDELSELSLKWAKVRAREFTGRDIEFVNFKEPVVSG
jgi:hypothetical protein